MSISSRTCSERVGIARTATTVKEGRNDFDDLLAPAVNAAFDPILPSLALMVETMQASALQTSPT